MNEINTPIRKTEDENMRTRLVEALASCVTVLTIADQIGGPSAAVRANILRDAHAALAAAKGETD